jgi:hypothetical protein
MEPLGRMWIGCAETVNERYSSCRGRSGLLVMWALGIVAHNGT